MGVDVASFGDYEAPADKATPLVFEDPFAGVYKKLLFTPDGTRLLGGILVGDAADYGKLLDARQERRAAALPAARADRRHGRQRRRGRRRRDARRRPRSARATTSPRARSARRSASKDLTTLDEVKALHQGRHRLRRLHAAGDRLCSRPS